MEGLDDEVALLRLQLRRALADRDGDVDPKVLQGGVRLLTKSVALYCGRKGYKVRCNSIHPGLIDTPMGDQVLNWLYDDPAKGLADRERLVPLGEVGQPEDVANAALYLASDESRYVTGAELVVDGGYTIY